MWGLVLRTWNWTRWRSRIVHCHEKVHEHSRRHKCQWHLSLHLWPSESDPPTSKTATHTHFKTKPPHKHKNQQASNFKHKFTRKWDIYFRGASGVVNGARDEDFPLAIDENGLPVICHTAMDQLRTNKEGCDEQYQKLGNWVGFHSFSHSLTLSLFSSPQWRESFEKDKWV